MSVFRIKTLTAQRKAICDQAGELVRRIAIEQRSNSNRQWTGEETQEWNRMHAEADRLDKEREKLLAGETERQEARQADGRMGGFEDIPGPYGNRESVTEVRHKMNDAERDATRRFLLDGSQGLSDMERRSYFRQDMRLEHRALSDYTAALGGATVPQGFAYSLEVATKYFGGIVDAASYIDTDMGNLMPWPSMNDTTNAGEVITENTQVAGSSGGASEQDPAYSVVNFNAWMFDTGFVLVPIQLLQDSAFNVEQYLDEQLQIRIGRKLNNLCTVGAGASSNQPNGVITAVGSSNTYTGGAANAVSYADTINLEYQVDLSYRRKASYMMHDTSVKSVRLLTDSNGRPLWIAGGVSEGIINKAPDTLNGYPVWVNNDVPTIGAGNKSMLFGDFSKYKIRRVKTTQLVRANERFIDKLQVGFLAFQRFDGNLVDAGTHPIAVLQHPAS